MHTGRLPFMPVFLAGFFLGIVIMNMGKSILLEKTGLLDEGTLYHMKYMTVNSNALFYYVLRQRLGTLLVMVVFATTYLGLAVELGVVLWYGLAGGLFLSALVIRYGLKGVLFAAAGTMPQYLLYVPAMILLLCWCENVCRSIYFRHTVYTENGGYGVRRENSLLHKKTPIIQALLLGAIAVLVIMGCMLESYVNPFLLGGLLKVF